MKILQTSWRTWVRFWNILLACLFALFVFVLLNIVSAGLLVTVVTVSLAFFVYALIHYWFWGHAMDDGIGRIRRPVLEKKEFEPPHEFVVELDDRERAEVLRLLERSLSSTNRDNEQRTQDVRKNLLQKIRMFGA